MTRFTLDRCYQIELRKLQEAGWFPTQEQIGDGWTIEHEAGERANEAYADLVDQGRQRAKDREIDRNA